MKKQSSPRPVSTAVENELKRLREAVAYQERKGNADTLYHRQLKELENSLAGGKEEITNGELE